MKSPWYYIVACVSKIRRRLFTKEFCHIGKGSGFGTKGYGNRCIVIGKDRISIGDNSWFGQDSEVIVYHTHFKDELHSKLTIGNNVRCTSRCRITCAGRTTIGNNVLIAPDVFITDHNHGMNPEMPGGYSPQPIIIKDVNVEDGVWLGQRVCVMPGVTVGAHSIIGANSVVTHDIPPYSIAVGAPARVVKQWDHDQQEWVPIKNDNRGE